MPVGKRNVLECVLSQQDATEWSNWGELMQESKKQLLGGNNLVTFTMCEGGEGEGGGLCVWCV